MTHLLAAEAARQQEARRALLESEQNAQAIIKTALDAFFQTDLDGAIRLAKPMYSIDGRIRPESAETVRRVLAGSLEQVRNARIDLSLTYTNQFLPEN